MGLATDGLPPFKGISSRSRVHPPGNVPCILPHKPRHTLLSCTILLVCLTYKPLFFKHSFTVSIHLFQGLLTETSSTHSYIDPFSNPVVLHSLHMAKPSENTCINLFVHTLRHSAQLPCPWVQDSIQSPDTQQTSEVVNLYNPNS